jgi:dTDP-4-dehydrorhamnose 3,5-epimerase
MIFDALPIDGAFVVEQQLIGDARGSFGRAFCQREFDSHGITFDVRQMNTSVSAAAGTIRGFHGQFPPYSEQKFLRCTRGAVVDAIIDLRPESPTFLRTHMVELSADNRLGVLIPERCAHALQTLVDDTEVFYLVSAHYEPSAEYGLRWNDPDLALAWPLEVTEVSAKDAAWPLLAESITTFRARMSAD